MTHECGASDSGELNRASVSHIRKTSIMSRITHLSDGDLEAMLADIESDRAERKQSFKGDSPNKVRVDVCAFANDLPDHRAAGVVFIGVKDDGTPAELPITDELLRELADIKTDGRILPPPTLTVQKRTLRGSDVAVIVVEPSDSPPVRFDGRVHIRIGSRRGIASAQDERILNEKRRFRDQPFDIHPVPTATLDDLNRRLFEDEYLPSAFAPDILEANGRSYEQRLAACKMIASAADPTPTVLGLLCLGIRGRDFLPGAYVQFLRIDGTDYDSPIVDEALIDGPIGQMVRQMDEKLSSHNRVAVDFTSGSTERRASIYPLVALQQLTRNAILHRSYEATNAPIRVYWFADRIEIQSPGGPFGTVTPENFGQPGITDYRNPNVAEAMRVLGFVQRFGFGIQLARRELSRNGNPDLEVTTSGQSVLCRVRPAGAQQ
ncbi:ATP-binding protein [Tahibacter amnicola]|uniref:DNA binding domain-containing protein n=1 Tax=Tahibacter amnicola TaxID=2976241 RepID=A0ABY6BDX8_9GAMM|nr:ATP-binding protein [Tahibacter amnicola]UXI68010.1 putative DNA binding domain-containing protein [Tahibacter amnicola]